LARAGAPRPVESSQALIEAAEDEFLFEELEEPARRVHFVFLERHTWIDPETDTLIAVEVPREDLLLVPVAMQ
jgi:hypothetical protein